MKFLERAHITSPECPHMNAHRINHLHLMSKRMHCSSIIIPDDILLEYVKSKKIYKYALQISKAIVCSLHQSFIIAHIPSFHHKKYISIIMNIRYIIK